MTRMSSTVTDDDGNGVAGVYVYAQLQGSPWLAGHHGQVATEVSGYTNHLGRWILDLTPAAALEDTGSWWLVRIFQRGSLGVDVPPPPTGDALVDIAGHLRAVGPPPAHADDYVLASRLGVPDGVATLGSDGILTLAQRPPLPSQGLGFRQSVSSPATLVQLLHGLSFAPAGITCLEPDGSEVEYQSVAHPAPGITELGFGAPFTGTVYVS